MADVYLNNGKAWFIEDYEDSQYDKTLNEQDISGASSSNPFARKQDSMDISFPYTGVTPRYAFTAAMSKGTVISRDNIETDYHDIGLFGGSNERQRLSSVNAKHFKNAFWEKYRDFEEANILFTDSDAGMFGGGAKSPRSLYTSSADLTVIAYNDDLDESHEVMLETRKEVEKDLQRLANKFL